VGIPVAIKVLQEDAGQAAELLDEARVMASVNDTYCVPIVAVCMTAQLMLLTQLMPHGSLLDYVRAHKSSVDSHTLLIWATQIAKVRVQIISSCFLLQTRRISPPDRCIRCALKKRINWYHNHFVAKALKTS
jgi:serine/threonine protein kinase